MIVNVIVAIVVIAIAADFTVVVIVVGAYAFILAALIRGILRSLLFAGSFSSFILLVAVVCLTCIRRYILIYNFRSIGTILNNVCMGIIVSCIRS